MPPRRCSVWTLSLLALVLALTACAPTSTTAFSSDAEVLGAVDRADDGWQAWVVSDDRRMPDVTLTHTDGEPYDLRAETAGTPTLLFFGYTSCPDVCPVHLATIAAALDRPAAPELGEDLQMIFVSVDPETDTPAVVDDFLGQFDAEYVGLTGDEETIAAAMRSLGLPEAADEPEDTIGHVSQVTGFDADGVARVAWPFGTRQSDWANDLPRLVSERW